MVINRKVQIRLVILIGITSFFNSPLFAQERPILILEQNPESVNFGTLLVKGLDKYVIEGLRKQELTNDEWQQVFSVQTGSTFQIDFPQVAGSYSVSGTLIIFSPRFSFSFGTTYNAGFNLPMVYSLIDIEPPSTNHRNILSKTFMIPPQISRPGTLVSNIYPSADTIPMNQLKLYIYFTESMRFGQAYENIRLINAKGEIVEHAFLEIREELWDSERKRFTLWFDPGRIKRDLAPNLQMGLPLKEGNDYQLVISKNWKDKFGNPMIEDYVKKFYVTGVDRESPNAENWEITVPVLGSKDVLKIDFTEFMDYPLLHRMIWIEDLQGEEVEGEIVISGNEKIWEFHPFQAWQEPVYKILIDTDLEDLAGNNLRRLFDSDITKDKVTAEQMKEIIIHLNQN